MFGRKKKKAENEELRKEVQPENIQGSEKPTNNKKSATRKTEDQANPGDLKSNSRKKENEITLKEKGPVNKGQSPSESDSGGTSECNVVSENSDKENEVVSSKDTKKGAKLESAKKKTEDMKEKINDFTTRARSPLDTIQQKNQDAQSSINDVSSKVSQPIQNLQSKQAETQSQIDIVTSKINSVQQVVDNKDSAFSSAMSDSTSSLSNAQGSLDSSRQNIAQTQQDFTQASDLVQQIKDKIAGMSGSAVQGLPDNPGGT